MLGPNQEIRLFCISSLMQWKDVLRDDGEKMLFVSILAIVEFVTTKK
jgi:hypothetical protein